MPYYSVDPDRFHPWADAVDFILEWGDDLGRLRDALERDPAPHRSTVFVYAEDEYAADGVNKIIGHINAEVTLHNLERGKDVLYSVTN